MPKTGIRSYETKTRGRRWLAYYDHNKKKVLRRGFRTSREAERWRAEAMTSARSPADTKVTVGEWLRAWLERHRSHIRPSTHVTYEGSVRLWIAPYVGMVRLVDLSHRHIEAMHNAALEQGCSPRTIRRNHTPLRSALEDALRDGIIPSNPASLVRLPPLHKTEIDPFTCEEMTAFLDGNRGHRLYPVYHLALYSGLRLGEILALQVGRDIDLLARTLTVRETRRQGVVGPPKSKESARRVMLGPTAVKVLGEAISDKPWGELVFPVSPEFVSHSMTQACKRAGVKRLRMHDLRHTHATLLLAAGQSLRAVSARLGHASAAFTLQVYGHVLPGMDEEIAAASETIFSANVSKTYHELSETDAR